MPSVCAHVSHSKAGWEINAHHDMLDRKASRMRSNAFVLLTSSELHQFHEVNGSQILEWISFFIVFVIWDSVLRGVNDILCMGISQRTSSTLWSHLARRHDGWIWPMKPAIVMTLEVMTPEVQLNTVYKQSCQNASWGLLLCVLVTGSVLIAVFASHVMQLPSYMLRLSHLTQNC